MPAPTGSPAGGPAGAVTHRRRTGGGTGGQARRSCSRPTCGRQSRRGHRRHNGRRRHCRDRRSTKQAPSRKINPGDLVCGACGEGNDPERNYCRRCGSPLAEATVAPTRWFRRRPKRAKKVVAAGDRPGQPGRSTSGRDAARGARGARGKFLGGLAGTKRILALLAIVGIGVGVVIPSLRNWLTDNASAGFNRVKRTVSPEYTNIAVDPARITSSGETPGGEAANVADGNTLTFWAAPPTRHPHRYRSASSSPPTSSTCSCIPVSRRTVARWCVPIRGHVSCCSD